MNARLKQNSWPKIQIPALGLLLLWIGYSFTFITTAMAVASTSYFVLCTGLYFRKTKNIHAPLMALGILTDLALVLTLQIQKNAIQTALSLSLSFLQQSHVMFSSLATVLYFPILAFGAILYFNKSDHKIREWHLKLGPLAFLFRTIGYVLMFSMLQPHSHM